MSSKQILITSLQSRKQDLENTLAKAKQILSLSVTGCLEVNKNNNYFRYYLKEPASPDAPKGKRIYIKDIETAKALANRDYAKIIYESANEELSKINTLLNLYSHITSSEDCYQALHPGRKLLVQPLTEDDEQYATRWLSVRKQINPNTYPMKAPILTENNEIVRSKSEKIIADKLKLLNIPYKYEEPIIIENQLRYPDFTVLNKKTRKTYFWEHLGMLDNPEYFQETMNKLEIYFRNRIIPGKNLIITYETSSQPLSTKAIDGLIREYLI